MSLKCEDGLPESGREIEAENKTDRNSVKALFELTSDRLPTTFASTTSEVRNLDRIVCITAVRRLIIRHTGDGAGVNGKADETVCR
jgi:hypothetical protein